MLAVNPSRPPECRKAYPAPELTQAQEPTLSATLTGCLPKIITTFADGIVELCITPQQNENRVFENWCELVPEELKPFIAVKETVFNWYSEIFNYFDFRYTNAVTESINNLIKSIEKEGRGYTFEVIRAKILYTTKATKKPVYKAKPRKEDDYSFRSYITFIKDDKELVHGTMCDCLELAEEIKTWKNPQS